MSKLKVIFSRSRRPLIGSLFLLVLGIALMVVVLPKFANSLVAAINTETKIDPTFPPDFQEMIRQEIRETFETFYLWTAALVVTSIILASGVRKYLKIRAIRKARESEMP